MGSEAPKARRQALIAEMLQSGEIGSQTELRARLAADGLEVTQPTLSRDLVELRAVRVRTAGGELAYAIPEDGAFDHPEASEKLRRLCPELLLRADASANLVVARTPAGAAQFLASALDRAAWPDVLGCVAGDDTIMIVTRDVDGGVLVAERLMGLGPLSRVEDGRESGVAAGKAPQRKTRGGDADDNDDAEGKNG